MTFGLRFLFFGLLIAINLTITAQNDDPITILPDDPTIITLAGEITPTTVTFDAQSGDVITLTARNLSDPDPVDLVLEILRPNGQRLAFNDDHFLTEDTQLAPADSAIQNLILPDDGTYTVFVNSYGGIFATEAEITLQFVDLFAVETLEASDTVTQLRAKLPRYQTFSTTLTVTANQTMTITARDISGTLDPRVIIRDENGTVIAENDDHNSSAVDLNVFDSRLILQTETDTNWVINIVDFLGRSGDFSLEIMSN